jgi:predicted ribosomally synthesized peptide with SipW-like signal peptide
MTTLPPPRLREWWGRAPVRDRVRALLAAGTVLGLGAISTTAAWTDQATATSGAFTVGSLDIKLNGVDSDPPAFTTSFAAANLAPGSSVSAELAVKNAGTLPFTYTMAGTATNNGAGLIGDALVFEVRPGTCPSVAANVVTGGKLTFTAISMGTIVAADTKTLCFKATLASDAASSLMTKTTTATFSFVATL